MAKAGKLVSPSSESGGEYCPCTPALAS